MASSVSDDLEHQLTLMQRRVVDEGRQVLVIFEGRSGRVMGRVINELMNLLEPRGMFYSHFIPESVDSPREMLRYISREPAKGVIGIYDRSWYSRIVGLAAEGRDVSEFIGTSMALERYFSNNGVVLVKFYLNMDDDAVDRLAKEFATRISKTESFLTDDHIDPKKWKDKVVMPMIAKTSTVNAPWDIVDVSDIDVTMATVVRTLISRVNHAMDAGIPVQPVPPGALYPNPRLSADLSFAESSKSYPSRWPRPRPVSRNRDAPWSSSSRDGTPQAREGASSASSAP